MSDFVSDPDDRRAAAIVADDDDFFRLALTGILRTRFGFGVVQEVSCLEEAAALLGAGPDYAFASFDLGMPGMEDLGRMRALRLAHPATRLAIVSGSFDRDVVLRALSLGLHGYMHKTMGAAELGRAIGIVLDGGIFVPPALAEIGEGMAAPPGRPRPELTGRQRQVLDLIARGATNRDIADELRLGEGTVKIHVAGLLKALGVANRSAAAATVRALGAATKS